MELYYKVSHLSEIAEEIFDRRESFEWYSGRNNDQFQVKDFPQTYIEKDSFLRYISSIIPGTLKLFKFPPKCYYRWHIDRENLYNFNLTFVEQDSFVLFENSAQSENHFHNAVKPISILRYEPRHWYLFNAAVSHSVYNLSDNWRYLLTYNVPKTIDISFEYASSISKKFGPS
jgi:hypothetical protein